MLVKVALIDFTNQSPKLQLGLNEPEQPRHRSFVCSAWQQSCRTAAAHMWVSIYLDITDTASSIFLQSLPLIIIEKNNEVIRRRQTKTIQSTIDDSHTLQWDAGMVSILTVQRLFSGIFLLPTARLLQKNRWDSKSPGANPSQQNHDWEMVFRAFKADLVFTLDLYNSNQCCLAWNHLMMMISSDL